MNSKVKTTLLVAGGAVVGGLVVGCIFLAKNDRSERVSAEPVAVKVADVASQTPAKSSESVARQVGGKFRLAKQPPSTAVRSQPQTASQPRVNVEAVMRSARPNEAAKAVQKTIATKSEAKQEVKSEPVKPEEKKGFWSRLFGK